MSHAQAAPGPPEHDGEFGGLLQYLRDARGFDFSGYKPTTLRRRIAKRMHAVGVASHGEYEDYLEVHPEEFPRLFDTILINVTSFFRDPETWEYLASEIVPAVVGGLGSDEPSRVWSAGCAAGQEPYTLAMVFCEALGVDAFRERLKIYATDLDEDALATARQASYTPREVESVPPELFERYFQRSGRRHIFRPDLRRSVIFGRHDLAQDAPISRVSLLLCRNTLMYCNSDTQAAILSRLHFALRDHGYLMLGKAEMLLSHGNLFIPVELKRRVFTKVAGTQLRTQLLAMTRGDQQGAFNYSDHGTLSRAAFESNPVAEIVVDASGALQLVNRRAAELFGIEAADVGRAFGDLPLSYRPVDLEPWFEQAVRERRAVDVGEVEMVRPDGSSWLQVEVVPVFGNDHGALGLSVTFRDVTLAKELQHELERTNRELDTTYEELQSTNEELETTNEELQSTVEEQETTNEELQSTNEELETMNEELQSTNAELQAINDELGRRTQELDRLNTYLEAILSSMRGGVVVVDDELRVGLWSEGARDMWGLRPDEALGGRFEHLDIGLPVERLREPLRDCLGGKSGPTEVTLEAASRRGHRFRCRVRVAPLRGDARNMLGVILVMEETDRA